MALAPFGFGGMMSGGDPFGALALGLEDPMWGFGAGRPRGADLSMQTYPMDIEESERRYDVFADAPGMTPDEVHVDINEHKRVLIIRGTHTDETKSVDDSSEAHPWHVRNTERVKRSFVRSFNLPKDADTDNIVADLEAGILNVRIPKKDIVPKVAPRKIPVITHPAHKTAGGHIEAKKTTA